MKEVTNIKYILGDMDRAPNECGLDACGVKEYARKKALQVLEQVGNPIQTIIKDFIILGIWDFDVIQEGYTQKDICSNILLSIAKSTDHNQCTRFMQILGSEIDFMQLMTQFGCLKKMYDRYPDLKDSISSQLLIIYQFEGAKIDIKTYMEDPKVCLSYGSDNEEYPDIFADNFLKITFTEVKKAIFPEI